MSLNVYRRKSGVFYIRGAHHGVAIDRSARTRVRAEAEAVREKLHRQIFDEQVLGKPQERSFAEAALGYMRGGGESDLLTPILLVWKDRPLSAVTQDEIDQLAFRLYPDGQGSTRNRKIYTPISAVMNWAADAYRLPPFRIRRPKQPAGRLDWRTPAEIERWLDAAGDLAPLLTFYVGTGARASEAINLDWKDVSPAGQRAVLWETKGGYARHVDLQSRVREKLPTRQEGCVWRSRTGDPWHAYDAVNLRLTRIAERTGLPPIHLHVFRHTWATWAYAVTRDLTFLMSQGGWRSAQLAMRYIHLGTDDLADQVLKHKWEIRGKLDAKTGKTASKTARSNR